MLIISAVKYKDKFSKNKKKIVGKPRIQELRSKGFSIIKPHK